MANQKPLIIDGGTTKRLPSGDTLTVAALIAERKVSARTSATSPAASDSRTLYTNEGTSSQVGFTLPGAVAGLEYTFVVQDADGIQITAASGDTIRVGASVSTSGGTATSSTIGDSLQIVALNTTEWFATSVVGSWTLA